jgi:ketosteroid isomerase-like protein
MHELFREWYSEPWQGYLHMEVDHLIDLGDDRVLGLVTFRGTGEGSGVPVEQQYAHLLWFRDGVNVRIDGFATWKGRLQAAGLDRIPG